MKCSPFEWYCTLCICFVRCQYDPIHFCPFQRIIPLFSIYLSLFTQISLLFPTVTSTATVILTVVTYTATFTVTTVTTATVATTAFLPSCSLLNKLSLSHLIIQPLSINVTMQKLLIHSFIHSDSLIAGLRLVVGVIQYECTGIEQLTLGAGARGLRPSNFSINKAQANLKTT